MTGADRYSDAGILLRDSRKEGLSDTERRFLLAEALVHATLAQAAATALTVTYPVVGDSAEVTEWARVVQPGALAGGRRPAEVPENWPPRLGDIWQDREGRRWVACRHRDTAYLECLAMQADDSAEEINRLHGPMSLVSRPDAREVECPF